MKKNVLSKREKRGVWSVVKKSVGSKKAQTGQGKPLRAGPTN